MRQVIQTAFVLLALLTAVATAQDAAPDPPAGGSAASDTHAPPLELERDPIKRLENLVARLQDDLARLRHELAETDLGRREAVEELAELRQFIADHHEYGRDFEQYTAVRAAAEAASRDAVLRQRRADYEARKAERRERQDAARAARAERQAEQDRVNSFRRSGFTPIGVDVFMGKNAYSYASQDSTFSRIDWAPGFGHYERLYPGVSIDFNNMTISGSILNAADTIRNIGVAVTFFDEQGNQVGHEIVQIENARPDVPYPFTSRIQMALDRPFTSTTSYVLYADRTE